MIVGGHSNFDGICVVTGRPSSLASERIYACSVDRIMLGGGQRSGDFTCGLLAVPAYLHAHSSRYYL
jgi:hypothetical protein